jgi:lipoyl(octanoyl) transferase
MKTVFWDEHANYADMCQKMAQCVHAIKRGHVPEQIWYVEHSPVYTCGQRSGADLDNKLPFPLIKTQRGGQITFHGPGQRVLYVMIDLQRRDWDIHHYIDLLEQWMIQTLAHFSIRAWGGQRGRGVWTDKGKMASIGIKVTSGITWHGMACNITNNLDPFRAIAPCGVEDQNMTSMACFIPHITMHDVDQALVETCPF